MDVDSEGARWAQSDDSVTWCDSAEALVDAMREGHLEVEVGGVEQPGPVMQVLVQNAPRLRSLSLCGCHLGGELLLQLGRALASSRITGIGVSNNPGLDVQTWAGFWDQLPGSILKWDFGDNELPDAALPLLLQAVGRGVGARELFLDGNCLTDLTPLLPALAGLPSLTELDVGDNSFTDAQVRALAAALPGSSVGTLVLGRNLITDAGAVALAAVLPQTRIGALYLDGTQIGDATLDALVGVLASTQLEELHVDETQVTDAGVMRLCQALPASKLNHLDAGDHLLQETIAAIDAALPGDACVE